MKQAADGKGPGRKTGERNLLQLVYISTATRGLTSSDLQAISDACERHNGPAKLTGLLLYQGGFFHGVLEGPAREVLRRMEVIITDDRHKDLRIVREQEASSRRFANWTFSSLSQSEHFLTPIQSQSEFLQILAQRLR